MLHYNCNLKTKLWRPNINGVYRFIIYKHLIIKTRLFSQYELSYYCTYLLTCLFFAVIRVKNDKGKPLLIYEGYSFYLHKIHKSKLYWRYRNGRNGRDQCKARLITSSEGDLLRVNSDHNHPPFNNVIQNDVCLLEILNYIF